MSRENKEITPGSVNKLGKLSAMSGVVRLPPPDWFDRFSNDSTGSLSTPSACVSVNDPLFGKESRTFAVRAVEKRTVNGEMYASLS